MLEPLTGSMNKECCSHLVPGAFKVLDAPLPAHLAGIPFARLVEWLYRTSGFLLIGVIRDMPWKPAAVVTP